MFRKHPVLLTRPEAEVHIPGSGRTWGKIGIAAVIFLLAMILLAGDKNLFKVIRLHREARDIQAQILEMQEENQRLREQIKELQRDPRAVELIAREELGLVGRDEIVYQLVPRHREGND